MSVAKEIRKLTQEPMDGIKVIMNEEDVTDINAEIKGPGTCRAQKGWRMRACCGGTYIVEERWPALTAARCSTLAADATPFESGTFRVKLVLPSDYPSAPPKGA